MHQLVANDVVGLRQGTQEGQNDAAFEEFSYTLCCLVQRSGESVGLLEMRVCRIDDENLASAQLVVEEPRQPCVPALGHERSVLGLHLVVVVDVEVLGLQYLEVEVLVLHLVSAEVLCLCRRRRYPEADGTSKQGYDWHTRSESHMVVPSRARMTSPFRKLLRIPLVNLVRQFHKGKCSSPRRQARLAA